MAEESSSDLNPASILDPILATDDVLGTCPKVIEMSNVARPVMVDRRLSKSNLFFLSRKTTSSDLLSLKYISNLDKGGQIYVSSAKNITNATSRNRNFLSAKATIWAWGL